MKAMVVLCTAPNATTARVLAGGIVNECLGACVNVIGPVRSYYRWEGELQQDEEVQLVIKTVESRLVELTDWIVRHHPYDVPEVVALEVAAGLPTYLSWIGGQTRG